MAEISIAFGVALMVMGMLFYIGTDTAGLAAWIPPLVGASLVICGLLAFKRNLRMHAMHVAAGLGLVGLLMTISGIIKVIILLAGVKTENPPAVIEQALTATLLIVFLILCLRSFINARRI